MCIGLGPGVFYSIHFIPGSALAIHSCCSCFRARPGGRNPSPVIYFNFIIWRYLLRRFAQRTGHPIQTTRRQFIFIEDLLEDPPVTECKPAGYLTTYLNCNFTDLIVDMSIWCTLKYVKAWYAINLS